MLEAIGLLATLFVLTSFTANSEKKIRQINIGGAILFVIYGLLIAAPSVYILNGALFFIHIYKLKKLSK